MDKLEKIYNEFLDSNEAVDAERTSSGVMLSKQDCLTLMDMAVNKTSVSHDVSDWVLISDKIPICYKTGGWDGKMSDLVIVLDSEDKYHLANMYEYYDGTLEWYDADEFGLQYEVVKWRMID